MEKKCPSCNWPITDQHEYCPKCDIELKNTESGVSGIPKKDMEKYLEWLIECIKKYSIDVFFPMDDDTLSISIKYRKQIETGIDKGVLRKVDHNILAVMVMGIHEYCYEYFHTNNLDKEQGIKMLEVVMDVIFHGILKK